MKLRKMNFWYALGYLVISIIVPPLFFMNLIILIIQIIYNNKDNIKESYAKKHHNIENNHITPSPITTPKYPLKQYSSFSNDINIDEDDEISDHNLNYYNDGKVEYFTTDNINLEIRTNILFDLNLKTTIALSLTSLHNIVATFVNSEYYYNLILLMYPWSIDSMLDYSKSIEGSPSEMIYDGIYEKTTPTITYYYFSKNNYTFSLGCQESYVAPKSVYIKNNRNFAKFLYENIAICKPIELDKQDKDILQTYCATYCTSFVGKNPLDDYCFAYYTDNISLNILKRLKKMANTLLITFKEMTQDTKPYYKTKDIIQILDKYIKKERE